MRKNIFLQPRDKLLEIINMDNSKIENDASEIDITTKFEYVCSMCPSKFSNKSSLFEQFDSKHLKL